jgi:hypothetical protein
MGAWHEMLTNGPMLALAFVSTSCVLLQTDERLDDSMWWLQRFTSTREGQSRIRTLRLPAFR